MFPQKIVLLGENIIREKYEQYNVAKVIKINNLAELESYSHDLWMDLLVDAELVIVSDEWEDEKILKCNKLLLDLGLCIVDDYIYTSMFIENKLNPAAIYCLAGKDKNCFADIIQKITKDKEIIVLHGNCQTHTLGNMLSSNKEFNQKYLVCATPRLWVEQDEDQWKLFFDSGILNLANYLFVQEIASDNRWGYNKSTDYVISQLSDTCTVYKISKLFFMGYFPQLKLTHMHNKVPFFRNKIHWLDSSVCIDKEVIQLILDNSSGEFKTAEEIADLISKNDYFKQDEIKYFIEAELNAFEKQEKNVDIKMCDYLKDNYDKFLMFVTNVHPTKKVLEEFARRILRSLNIMDMTIMCEDGEIQRPMPPDNKFVIYPSVLKKFSFSDQNYSVVVELQGEELLILNNIKPELDLFIEENKNNNTKHRMTLQLNFRQYMLLSIRYLQAVLHT